MLVQMWTTYRISPTVLYVNAQEQKNITNKCLTSASGPLGARPAEQLVPDHGTGPMQKVQKKELAGVIQQALESLNERQRMAVVLNKFEDMNYADIAEVMGLTTKAIKSLLSRARMNLRTALADYIFMDGTAVPEPDDEDEAPRPAPKKKPSPPVDSA